MFIKSKIYRCPACSSVFGYITLEYMEPVLFQRGPRKGEVKDIIKREKKLYVFSDSILRHSKRPAVHKIAKQGIGENGDEDNEITLYICPKCMAVFGEEFPTIQVHEK